MDEEQAEELKKNDRVREEHPFELNMVMQEEDEEGSQDQCPYEYPVNISDDRVLIAGVICDKELDVENRKRIVGRLHCFPTKEEEEGTQDQCPYEYPVNISDDRVLITGVISEEELDVENRKRRVDIDR